MRDIGLLSPEALELHDGTEVQPLHVLKALLPDPTSLARGTLVKRALELGFKALKTVKIEVCLFIIMLIMK